MVTMVTMTSDLGLLDDRSVILPTIVHLHFRANDVSLNSIGVLLHVDLLLVDFWEPVAMVVGATRAPGSVSDGSVSTRASGGGTPSCWGSRPLGLALGFETPGHGQVDAHQSYQKAKQDLVDSHLLLSNDVSLMYRNWETYFNRLFGLSF